MITIDGNRPVYDIIQEYPDLRQILIQAGFEPLANDAMLNTAGRMMNLNGGIKRVKIDEKM